MTEEELFEMMRKEYPQDRGVAFMLGIEHWHHNHKDGENTGYRLSIVPALEKGCHIIYSSTGWQEVYDKYLTWRAGV